MALENLNILINDTYNIAASDVVKYTQQGSPVLIYNGSDDEYQPIMASELSFSMLVPNAEDARFFYLFTGNETRYEVQLEDVTDINNPVILWQGFLLPDNYSEPYENSSFFVEFTATDGLGRLKNKFLAADFYKDKKTIPQILCACLAQTGNAFHTIIAPAITNAAAVIKVYDLELDTSNFIDNKKKKNAYEILEDLLTTMGCRLFQWKQTWYIIGINRMFDEVIAAEFYTVDGTYYNSGTNTITRNLKSVVFEASPNITAIPPFKTVTIDWDKDQRSNIFPVDVVYQKPKGSYVSNEYNLGLDINYWNQTGTDFFKILFFKTISAEPVVQDTSGPFYLNLNNAVTTANINTNYITLDTPVYIEGTLSEQQNIDIDLECVVWFNTDPTTALNADKYKQFLQYDITKDDVTLISNKPSFDTAALYDYEMSVGPSANIDAAVYYPLNCKFSFKGVVILTNGFINIKLYPIINIATAPVGLRVAYTKVAITYNGFIDDGILKKTRTIDFTSSKEIALNIGADRNDLTKNKLLISSNVEFTNYTYNVVAQYTTIPFIGYTNTLVNNEFLQNIKAIDIIFNINYYELLNNNLAHFYVKRAATGIIEPLVWFGFYPAGDICVLTQLVPLGIETEFKANDEFYLWVGETTVTETNARYLLHAWKRVGETENLTYLDALAQVYHSTIPTTKFKIEGSAFGLLTPLDVLQFQFRSPRNYNLSNLTMHLSEGMSSVLLIESLKENITDYE